MRQICVLGTRQGLGVGDQPRHSATCWHCYSVQGSSTQVDFLWLCSLQSTNDMKRFILSSHTSVALRIFHVNETNYASLYPCEHL